MTVNRTLSRLLRDDRLRRSVELCLSPADRELLSLILTAFRRASEGSEPEEAGGDA